MGRGGGLSSADTLLTREENQMQTSALFGAKTSDFSKFVVCPHSSWTRREEAEPVRTSGGGAQFFAILCGLGTCLFVKVPRVTFSVFESSCHLLLPI